MFVHCPRAHKEAGQDTAPREEARGEDGCSSVSSPSRSIHVHIHTMQAPVAQTAVFIPPPAIQSPLTIEVAMPPIPVPGSPSFLHIGWGPDHRRTLGTSLRLDSVACMGWSSACPFHPIPGFPCGTPPLPTGSYCGGVWLIKVVVAQPNTSTSYSTSRWCHLVFVPFILSFLSLRYRDCLQ